MSEEGHDFGGICVLTLFSVTPALRAEEEG